MLAGGAVADTSLKAARERFREAWQAMTAGRVADAERLADGLELYPLYPYLRYEYLRRRVHRVPAEELRQFLIAHEGSLVAARLRTQWLRHLAHRRDWAAFLDAYQPQRDVKLQCTQLLARIRTGRLEGVVQDALPLWLVGESQPEECDPAFELLYASPLMDDALLWQRIRLAMANGEFRLAAWLGRKLSSDRRVWVERWRAAHVDPARALASAALGGDAPEAREIAVYALTRLARSDVDRALALWEARRDVQAFTEEQQGEVLRAIAVAAEAREHPESVRLLDAVPASHVDARVQHHRLRAAIRTGAWAALARWTEQDARDPAEELRWRYWRARALERIGRAEEALALYRELANERDFYGFRAADRLGVEYRMHDRPIPFGERERAAIAAYPGMARARELYALGMVYQARLEWDHEITRMPEADLPLAAAYAHHLGWYDRAILTLARAGHLDDLERRFPTPYTALVERHARAHGLDPALLYGIIKSESAFMPDARSPAGALGLMQLMPATARETAQRLGVRLDSAWRLYEPDTNIELGSAYLHQLLERFGGNLALAAAAYNAGPHRVRAWLPDGACQAAEDWIELIPFTETRRYVRRTLYHTAVYQWRLLEGVRSLEERLAAVPGRHHRSTGGVC